MVREEGLMMRARVQLNRKAGSGPKASYRYEYSPPDFGIMVPISQKHKEPRRASKPHPAQTTKLEPTEPVCSRTPLGDMKIPEPIITPTTRAMPFIIVTCFFMTTLSFTGASPFACSPSPVSGWTASAFASPSGFLLLMFTVAQRYFWRYCKRETTETLNKVTIRV